MPIVPLNERRVATEAPVVGTPSVGSAVPGAFGEDVARAQERLGESGVKAGTTLLEHVNKMNYWDEKSKSAIYENEFSNLIDSKLHNTNTKDIQRDGQDYTIPAGYLDRNGEQARGAVADYDTEIKPLITGYASKIRNPAVQSELTTRLSEIYSTKRDVINTHEATQWRKSKVDSFEANLVNDSARAASAMSGPELQTYLDNIVTNNNSLAVFNGDSEAVRQKRQDEYLLKAVKNSVSSINESGNPELAMKILDSFKPRTTNAIEGYTGNIDLATRPVLHNANGTISTEKSMSIEENGKEILIPTIVDGKEVSKDEAIAHYHDTGENLGKFDTVEEADAMAQKIHNRFATTFMSPSDYEKIKKDVSMNRFLIDAKGDPELAKKRISDGYYGFDPKETDTALSALVHYKELEKKDFTQAQDSKFLTLLEKQKAGQLSITEIDNAVNNSEGPDGISEKRGNLLKKAVFAPVAQQASVIKAFYPETKPYIDAIDKYLVPVAGEQGQLEAYEYIIQAYGDGKISKEEKDALGMIKDFTPIRSLWWKFTKKDKDATEATDAINVVKMFLKRINKGEDQYVAAIEAQNDLAKYKDPTIIHLPKEGEERIDVVTKQKAIVYPTGQIKKIANPDEDIPEGEQVQPDAQPADNTEDSYGI